MQQNWRYAASNLTGLMKHLLATLLLTVLAAAQADAPPSETIPVDQANQKKAQAILDQAIQALGGQAYLSIQDVSQQGRTYSFHNGRPNSNGIVFWRFYKYPDKDRLELTKQRDVIELFNGDKGFELTFKGAEPQEAKILSDYNRRRHYALDYVLREWIHQAGMAFFYEGQTVAEGKNVDQISLMNTHNEGVTLYIDMDTHLPVKKTFSWRDPTDKERNVEDETWDNYRLVQGIMTPHTVTRFYNGDMSNQRFLNNVNYNQQMPDAIFDKSYTQPYGVKK